MSVELKKWINYYVDLEIPTYHEYEGSASWETETRTFLFPIWEGEDIERALNEFARGFHLNAVVQEYGLLEGAYRVPYEICTY